MKIFTAVMLTALVSGCASTYQDPRPLEVQQAELDNSLKQLSGQYDVIDSRNDFYNFTKFEARSVTVIRQGTAAQFLLVGKEKTILIVGNKCIGRNEPNKDAPWLYCDGQKGGLFAPVVELATKDKEIKLNGLFAEKAMQVKAGDYLFNFHESGSGRPHHYLLKKRAVAE